MLAITFTPLENHHKLYPGRWASAEKRNSFIMGFQWWITKIVLQKAPKDLADDALQDAFIAALKAYPLYNPKKGAFSTWVYKIVRNSVYWTKKRNKQGYSLGKKRAVEELEGKYPGDAVFVDHFENKIQNLSERTKEILRLRFLEGWTLQEVGEQLGYTRQRIQQLEKRGLAHLKSNW